MAETAAKWPWIYHGANWQRCDGKYSGQAWYWRATVHCEWPKFDAGVRYQVQFSAWPNQKHAIADERDLVFDNLTFYCAGSMMREIARLDKILSAYKR